jgi:hypothetical protein
LLFIFRPISNNVKIRKSIGGGNAKMLMLTILVHAVSLGVKTRMNTKHTYSTLLHILLNKHGIIRRVFYFTKLQKHEGNICE